MSGNMPGYTKNFHFNAWVKFSNIKKGSFFFKYAYMDFPNILNKSQSK